MIPLHCPASPLREPLSRRLRRAGCPTDSNLLAALPAPLGAQLHFTQGIGQPAPTAWEMAKLRKTRKRRLARTGGTMFCREVG